MTRSALLCICGLILVGCASTSDRTMASVPLVEDLTTPSASASAGGGSTASPSAGPGGGPSASAEPTAAVGDTSTPTVAAPSTSAASPDTSSPAPGPVTPSATDPGPTASLDPIVVGIHVSESGAAFEAAGLAGSGTSALDIVPLVVDDINRRGGVGGRELQVVTHVTNSTQGQFAQQTAAACAHFTEDNEVDVVIDGALIPRYDLPPCLAQRDVPLIWEYNAMVDRDVLATAPRHLFQPSMPAAEDLGVWIDILWEQGFLTADSTIGVLRYDDGPSSRFVARVIEPGLARYGLEVEDEFEYSTPSGFSDAGSLASQSLSAVLRMRASGVDRVLMVPSFGVIPVLLFPAAESQGWSPRYAFTGWDNVQFQVNNAGEGQLEGSMAVGWTPSGDTLLSQVTPTPEHRRCIDVTGATDSTAMRYCAGLFLVEKALADLADTSSSSIIAALERIGDAAPDTWTTHSSLSAAHHQGATVVRGLVYDGACQCFTYTNVSRRLR